MITIFQLALLALASAPQASAPSFDCRKASTAVERRICASATVSALDDLLAAYYRIVREHAGAATECFTEDQSRWLRDVRNRCADDACLETAYLVRLAELEPLVPAAAVRPPALPNVPALVLVIGPAADKVAFPRVQGAPVLDLTGSIAREDGDGFVLRAASGLKASLVPDMALEGGTATQLELLAKEFGSRFRVRGYAAQADGEMAVYEASRCVYVYRAPGQ